MSKKTSNATEWDYFPIRGLEITTDAATLSPMLFGWATIVSREDLIHFVREMPFAKAGRDTTAMRMVESMTGEEDSSYILIKGIGRTSSERDINTEKRSFEIASVISLIILARESWRFSCCLAGQVTYTPRYFNIRINTHSGLSQLKQGLLTRAFIHHIPDPPIRLSRTALADLLVDSPFGDLSKIVLFRDKSVDTSFHRVLSTAATLLYETINTTIPESQLIGAVTAMEVLLAISQTRFETIQFRVRLLLGEKPYDYYGADRIFKSRHAFVHEGSQGSASDVANGMVLAVSALAAVARIARDFPSHGAMIEYMEFMESFAKYVRHRPERKSILAVQKITPWFPDYFAFRLIAFAYSRKEIDAYDLQERRIAFSSIVYIYEQHRAVPRKEAFFRVAKALTDVESPFISYRSYAMFYARNSDTIERKGSKTYDVLKEYVWNYD